MSLNTVSRLQQVQTSSSAQMLARVQDMMHQGIDVISLNVGEPDLPTPEHIKQRGIRTIENNFTHYTSGNGIAELRKAIIKKCDVENHISYQDNEVTISNGAKQALMSAIMAIAQTGDEIIIPSPYYVSYPEMVKLTGAKPIIVDTENDYQLNINTIEQAITPHTKAVIICTPNNPTGAVYSEHSLRLLAALALQYDFYVICDEIYEKLIYDGNKHFSMASISDDVKKHVILINGFSKSYCMTGWRIGYVCANDNVIRTVNMIQSQTTTCVNTISQWAALQALTGPQNNVKMLQEIFERRMHYVVNRLNKIPGIHFQIPQGAFYVFVDIQACLTDEVQNDIDFCDYMLLHYHIACMPGSTYGKDNHIRISYSSSLDRLNRALERLESGCLALKRKQAKNAIIKTE